MLDKLRKSAKVVTGRFDVSGRRIAKKILQDELDRDEALRDERDARERERQAEADRMAEWNDQYIGNYPSHPHNTSK